MRSTALPVVVLMTDGIQPGLDDVRAAADLVKGTGALVYAIGLGADVDTDLLRGVASDPDRFYASPTADDLARIYAEIFERIACDTASLPGRGSSRFPARQSSGSSRPVRSRSSLDRPAASSPSKPRRPILMHRD